MEVQVEGGGGRRREEEEEEEKEEDGISWSAQMRFSSLRSFFSQKTPNSSNGQSRDTVKSDVMQSTYESNINTIFYNATRKKSFYNGD